MANGDYWKRNKRTYVDTGASGLDILDQILGITGNIAQGVQGRRNARETYDLRMINLLAGNYETEYSSAALSKNIEDVENYRNKKVDSMTDQSLTLIDTVITQMGKQQEQNLQFKKDINSVNSLKRKAGDWATDIYENWELKTEAERQSLIDSGAKDSSGVTYSKNYAEDKKKDFLNIAKDWAEAKGKMSEYDSRRLTGLHTSNMANIEVIVNGALDVYQDGIMSKLEIDTITQAVSSGNAQPLDELMRTQARQEANVTTSLYNELEQHRVNIENDKKALINGQFPVKYKDVKNFISEDEKMLGEWRDSDNYTINLNDGSPLANQYKLFLETRIAENQEKLINKENIYAKSSGKSYIEMRNLSDDFLGIKFEDEEELIEKPLPLKEEKPESVSSELGLDESLLDKQKNIEGVKKVKMKSIIEKRTDELNSMKNSINQIEVGGEYDLKGKGFSDSQIEEINKWNKKNYKRTKYKKRDEVLRRSNRRLNEIHGSYNNERNLSYESLKTLKSIFEEDTQEYNGFIADMETLKNAGEKNSQEYKDLKKKEEDYGIKWLGWWRNKKGKIIKSPNPLGDYGMYGLGSNKEELEKKLSFYDDLLKGFIETNSKQLDSIIKYSK
tara:strand:- start:3073 stop:4920 length:1848 start_codon:yes stop_codon:yes gene_type:complete